MYNYVSDSRQGHDKVTNRLGHVELHCIEKSAIIEAYYLYKEFRALQCTFGGSYVT